jgi:tellurite resistance protein TehA-like permease
MITSTPGPSGPLRDLDRPADAFASLGPNWFASVMGTGIVATAAATLPVQWPGLREFATVTWVLAAGWLVALAAAEIVHWARHRAAARLALPSPYGPVFQALGLVYGVPVWGFAVL